MSDMPRPAQPPRTPAHDQHDPLLVAQLVAGDPLEPARAQEASAWLATCPDCTATAADLQRVSAAVAAEPVPRRRRDYRLTPEQAEQLQGSALTRFFRGLSLPRTRALGPAAAGVMSVGLIFVVAGYAWPDDGSITVQSEADVAPTSIEAPTVSAPAPAVELPAEEREPAAPAAGSTADEAALEEALEAFAAEPELLEGLAEHQSGTSARSENMQKALQAELADDEMTEDALGSEGSRAGMAMPDAVDTIDGEAEPDTDSQRSAADAIVASEPTDGTGVGESSLDVPTTAVEDDLERWLILVGVALAVGGGLLLLLVWLSRRSVDPLLR